MRLREEASGRFGGERMTPSDPIFGSTKTTTTATTMSRTPVDGLGTVAITGLGGVNPPSHEFKMLRSQACRVHEHESENEKPG